jgi:hypothetical protein
MKTKFIVGIIVLLSVILINACENKQAVAPLTVAVPNSCDTTNLTYSSGTNTMQAIINVQCGTSNTQCHSPGSISGYDYSTYAGIYSNYQHGLLYGSLFGSLPRMPKIQQAGWDQCTIDKFRAWMDQGCPQ